MDGYELITADCTESLPAMEMFDLENNNARRVLASEHLIDDTRLMIEESTGWLPFIAELYNISADLKDYILCPVVIMPSDLPNRNAQAFPYEELIRANHETGQIGFETWQRMPTFIDHNNKDHTKAKGVIFSSMLKPIPNTVGNIHKVVALLGFDRKRDAILSNSILTGERPSYSMGAWARMFTCSVCGEQHSSTHQGCEHINAKMPRMKMFDGKLSYLQARYIKGFETSSVGKPAFYSATTPADKLL